MTREEAIADIRDNIKPVVGGISLDMAIKALEQQPCEMTVNEYRNRLMDAFHNADCGELIAVVVRPEESEFKQLEWLLKNHYHNQKQQPCEEAISRKDMLAIFRQSNSLSQAWNGFEKLPPVTPKSKSEYEHDHEVVKAYNDGQAYILDKIKAEVGLLGKDYLGCPQPQVVCDDVIKIIDKYRGDTDGKG